MTTVILSEARLGGRSRRTCIDLFRTANSPALAQPPQADFHRLTPPGSSHSPANSPTNPPPSPAPAPSPRGTLSSSHPNTPAATPPAEPPPSSSVPPPPSRA